MWKWLVRWYCCTIFIFSSKTETLSIETLLASEKTTILLRFSWNERLILPFSNYQKVNRGSIFEQILGIFVQMTKFHFICSVSQKVISGFLPLNKYGGNLVRVIIFIQIRLWVLFIEHFYSPEPCSFQTEFSSTRKKDLSGDFHYEPV